MEQRRRVTMISNSIRAALLSVSLLGLGACSTGRSPAITASTDKPLEFVLVHGAWGGGWAFRDVDKRLRADGNMVHRVTFTGQGERAHLNSPDITLETHVQDVVNTILYEDLHDVVLVGHSYGGMVITGVADRIPDRIGRLVYLDAVFPESGESCESALNRGGPKQPEVGGFSIPSWVPPDQPPPHDVPQSVKTFRDPLILQNPDAVRAIPTTYVLTVEAGVKPENDDFFQQYERAKARGCALMTVESDHNAQWSHPAELVTALEQAAVAATRE